MYQISFFSTCNFFSWWVFISWLVVKNIKCSPSNLKPAQILLQGCDCQCHKGQQPKCPQRGLGRISERSYLALGTQASQGMASSDKQAIPFVCTLHTKSLWAKFELQQQGWNALMCSVLEGALGQRQSFFFLCYTYLLKILKIVKIISLLRKKSRNAGNIFVVKTAIYSYTPWQKQGNAASGISLREVMSLKSHFLEHVFYTSCLTTSHTHFPVVIATLVNKLKHWQHKRILSSLYRQLLAYLPWPNCFTWFISKSETCSANTSAFHLNKKYLFPP